MPRKVQLSASTNRREKFDKETKQIGEKKQRSSSGQDHEILNQNLQAVSDLIY